MKWLGIILLLTGSVVVLLSNRLISNKLIKNEMKKKIEEQKLNNELETSTDIDDMKVLLNGLNLTVKIVGFSIAAVGAVFILLFS